MRGHAADHLGFLLCPGCLDVQELLDFLILQRQVDSSICVSLFLRASMFTPPNVTCLAHWNLDGDNFMFFFLHTLSTSSIFFSSCHGVGAVVKMSSTFLYMPLQPLSWGLIWKLNKSLYGPAPWGIHTYLVVYRNRNISAETRNIPGSRFRFWFYF